MPDLPRLLGFVAGAALDATLPDPPNSLHPVAAIGPCARFIEGFAPHEPDSRRRFGWLLAVFAPLLVALLVKRTQSATNPPARIVTDAGLLALASSRHTLFSRVADVADAPVAVVADSDTPPDVSDGPGRAAGRGQAARHRG